MNVPLRYFYNTGTVYVRVYGKKRDSVFQTTDVKGIHFETTFQNGLTTSMKGVMRNMRRSLWNTYDVGGHTGRYRDVKLVVKFI